MVEFALVLPVLLLVLFGIIQFGIAYNHYLTVTDAARVGARKAAVSRTSPDPVGAAVQAARSSAPDLDQSQLGVSVSAGSWSPGGDVTVRVTYPYSIKILGIVVKSGNLTSATTERIE
jgi:Flp pilus assembly protein TadG